LGKYFVSVDGGGTKTEFCVADIDGNIIKSYIFGSTNYKSVGTEKMFLNLQTGLNSIMKNLSMEIEDLSYIVFGISGYDSSLDYDIIYEQILRLGIPKEKFHLCNDSLLAFYAQAEEPGIVVISGTGSIVVGIDKKNLLKRAGGWGYYFSDMGSGYWIGKELLKRTLLYCDNVHKYSRLFDEVRKHYNARKFEDLPYKITEILGFDEIAKFSKLATEFPDDNEWLKRDILQEGATYLCGLIKNIYDSLDFKNEDNVNIVFSGSVLKNSLYSGMLKEAVQKELNATNIVFKKQINAPAFGGIKLAKRRYKGELNEK
jgi:N-acetylglucosamine kinase-like BadF-type ATPase